MVKSASSQVISPFFHHHPRTTCLTGRQGDQISENGRVMVNELEVGSCLAT